MARIFYQIMKSVIRYERNLKDSMPVIGHKEITELYTCY